ncbi:hypothetical protein [Luteolibacter sp. Populi]|uniref:hypothetical protein n=1 Tax=Luteolibacter sp. Populi TaxID=3230487 RepID=UPI0034660F74
MVDTSDRNEVVSFYHAIYMASEGYQNRVAWTGNYNSEAAGAEGTVSAAFTGDVERRLNYLRAMCGIPANVRVNTGATVRLATDDLFQVPALTTKTAASQRSALMIVRTYPGNGGLSHSPAPTCVAWTPAAWNANRNGNLSLGFFGPGALDAYAKEDVMGTSNWNTDAGHRRWMLFQGSTDFATGDTPGAFTNNKILPPSNSLYVMPRSSEIDFSADPVFASYPPKGYFPAKLNTPYWSLSYPGADFSAATVSMTNGAGAPVTTTVVSRRAGYGDNAIIWQVPAAASSKAVGADISWNVTVSNIQGAGIPPQRSWTVTLIDPEKIAEIPQITGSSMPPTSGATYQLGAVAGAGEMQAGFFLRKPATWSEGAEDSPATTVIDRTSGGYPFRASNATYVKSGSKAFRLTFPSRYDPFINGVPEQIMELDRDIIPGAAGKLNFQFRRGLMTGATKLAVETSVDSGLTWSSLGSLYSGLGGTGDAAFQAASLALPAGPVRVRFRFYLSDPASALYSHQDYPSQPTGVFIDDLTTSDCTWLERTATVAAPGLTTFAFNAATAATSLSGGQEWWLRARAVLGGKAFPWGPAKVVTPSGPLQLSGPAAPPLSGANYNFVPDVTATGYKLEVARLGPSNWTEGAETTSATIVPAVSNYSVYSNLKGFMKSGKQAFRLGLSTTADAEDSFSINRQILPASNSNLEFWVRRGGMSKTNRLHAEVSTDEGATWTSLWNLPGLQKAEKKVLKQTVSLASYADRPIRIRFAIRNVAGGKNLKWNAKSSGVFIDDITVTNSAALLSRNESNVSLAASHVRLDAATAGQPLAHGATMRLRMRSITGLISGGWGPALTVSPSSATPEPSLPAGFAGWAETGFPGLNLSFDGDQDRDGVADGIEYAFSLDPAVSDRVPDQLAVAVERIAISRDLPVQREGIVYGAQWSENLGDWSSDGVEIVIEAGRITASAPKGERNRFLRWQIEQE